MIVKTKASKQQNPAIIVSIRSNFLFLIMTVIFVSIEDISDECKLTECYILFICFLLLKIKQWPQSSNIKQCTSGMLDDTMRECLVGYWNYE
jgi:hypothetical protein